MDVPRPLPFQTKDETLHELVLILLVCGLHCILMWLTCEGTCGECQSVSEVMIMYLLSITPQAYYYIKNHIIRL